MRFSVLATALVLGACSVDSPSEPVNLNPTNPLVSLLSTQSATYALTQLGSQTTPPLLTWNAVCNGLPFQHEFADTIVFNGDYTYRRVIRYASIGWRTIGVPEPEPMRGHFVQELTGNIYGVGNELQLTSGTNFGLSRFKIKGTDLAKPERIGVGCQGGGTMVNAVYTRVPE